MSYITFNYRCSDCDHEEHRLVKREDMDFQPCDKCKQFTLMHRLPAGPRTHFRFNDTKLKR